MPDIVVRRGTVPRHLAGAIHRSPMLEIDQHRTARLAIDGVARYLVQDGREVIIDPETGAGAADIRTFLLGTVLSLLCLQRDLCPLHAAGVAIDGRAVLLAADSGYGKSTLAAALALRGHVPLADSFCVIDAFAAGGPQVLPSFPAISLWRDAATALGLPESGRLPTRSGLAKHRHVIGDHHAFPRQPVPLAAVAVLSWAGRMQMPAFIPLDGVAGAAELHRLVHRQRVADRWGMTPRLFLSMASIANQCQTGRLIRSHGLAGLSDTVAAVEKMVQQ
ncbi:MAG: hypothetical protein P4M00_01585 [Azospirillaceae bacterium]|nr:hypothetical protein [Azospirillaceae bacterium]